MNTQTRQLITQIENSPFLTDGGMETDFIFNKGIDLPEFASFDLLSTNWGRETLREYFLQYLALADKFDSGFILETPTWRANAEWGAKLGYDPAALWAVNRNAVEFLQSIRADHVEQAHRIFISGNIGPRGDGYVARNKMTAAESQQYHEPQIKAFAAAGVELVSAFTLNYSEEAMGIVRAAREADVPVVISFTLETDGSLPSGEPLGDAITAVDRATDNYVMYYMINCAHPTHFEARLAEDSPWKARIRGIRGNASRCSHAELDEAEVLDDGNPRELGEDYRRLKDFLPSLQVYGGCCGTDLRHVESIAEACLR